MIGYFCFGRFSFDDLNYNRPLNKRERKTHMRGNFGALLLIVIGSLALAHNLGYFNVNLARLFSTWWPIGLIALGLAFFITPSGKR